MRRRPVRRGPLPSHADAPGLDDHPASEAGHEVAVHGGDWEPWEESEAERVAEWLRSKTGLDNRNGDLRDQVETEPEAEGASPGAVRWRPLDDTLSIGEPHPAPAPPGAVPPGPQPVVSMAPSLEDLQQERARLASTVDAVEEAIDEERQRAAAAYEATEAEVRALRDQYAEVAATLARERSEADLVEADRRAVRERLQQEIDGLRLRRQELIAESERSEASVAEEVERLRGEAAGLRDEIARLQQESAEVRAATEAATRDEELARVEAEAEIARLAHEATLIAEERARLATEMEVTTAQIEEARRARDEVRARRMAEIDAERAATRSMVSGVATAHERLTATERSDALDPSGRLAETVVELGRRWAAMLEEERAEAERAEEQAAEDEATRQLAATLEEAAHDESGPGPAKASGRRRFFHRS